MSFTVAVKSHVLLAHSLRGEVFGPAQRLHGATYHVTAEWTADRLDGDGIVIDIGLATELLDAALAPLRYRNLDELPEFAGRNTTTEVLAQHVHQQLAASVAGRFAGHLRVVFEESHVAWAAFQGPV